MSPNESHKNKAYNLRLPNELRQKFEIIAKQLGYKKTSHAYKDLIENFVKDYETKNGEVKIEM